MRRTAPPVAAGPSVYRCAECGNGDHLRAWEHVNIHGDVGPDGLIERADYEDERAFDGIIEESLACKFHGEDAIEKFIGGRYVAISELALKDGRYVSRRPLPEGYEPLTWDQLVPYEKQQGGYWLYGLHCGMYGTGKIWVPVVNPAR